ncbi:MAG TPA: redox-regulated ATPase YchF [bacterium]|nr:redox-regulated ATPase YchF [bacterium]
MPLTCGIVGLPNVGKSTIFNAIANAKAEVSNYPFCTIKPNIGMVNVPDERLRAIFDIIKTKTIVPATLEFFDIAGLVKGASKGEGLGNQFLSHVRETDALLHVVRCFDDGDIAHVSGTIDPIRDIETVNMELILADLETVEKRMHKCQKESKGGNKAAAHEHALCERLTAALGSFAPARSVRLSKEDQDVFREFNLLTAKPVLFAANVGEEGLAKDDDRLQALKGYVAREGSYLVKICGKTESELLELSPDEQKEYLRGIGVEESGLSRVIRESFKLLDLISFFTHNEKELRSWTIPKGTKAPQAAGKIHTDFERGFIRAEVTRYADFVSCGGDHGARAKGLVHTEGKEYVVQDGDIVLFRFNV